jgi:hypothetical protein
MQVPTHNQGFEILRRNLFSYNKAFCQLVRNQNPNEALHPQIVRDFIRDPTTIDRILGNSDIERYLDPESNGWDYVLHPHVTRPLEGFEEILTLLQTHINFPRFLPIFPDFLERLSHLAPIY